MSEATFGGMHPAHAPSIAPTAMTGMQNAYMGQVFYNGEGQFAGDLDPDVAAGKHPLPLLLVLMLPPCPTPPV
ncbi:hypothetical protein QBC35DRAFT_454980 [Podospora australis]|uniref:Uncharacterized protein n=1 Tax=Podospora australis TaxID=1536484 RepID=A0AAN6WQW8_9PEZI|nr:hypothetical protein QBC35DRAFT_454980 [Podospora australis]